MSKTNIQNRIAIIFLMAVLMLTSVFVFDLSEVSAADYPVTATALVNAKGGVNMRTSAKTSAKKVVTLPNNTPVTVNKEIFTKKNSTSKKNRWYYITANGKTGYVRADYLDTFGYAGVTGTVTTKVNYRTGAGVKMKKKGTFSTGTVLTIVLTAREKASDTPWYKVVVGSKKYFLSSQYVTLNTVATAPTPAPAPAPAPAAVAAPAPTTPAEGDPTFSSSGVTYPTVLGTGTAFPLKGTITCSQPMTRAVFGVTDAAGNWVQSASADINSTSFNINKVDTSISFGKLPVGTYNYRGDIYVGDKMYTQVNYSFSIKNLVWPAKIASTAVALAWPKGTPGGTYDYSGGSATPAFQSALNAAYPNRSNWSAAPKAGASCDVFVGTVVRTSGYDGTMPRGLDEDWDYLEQSSKWTRVPYNYDTSVLQNGDIVIYKRTDGGGHIMVYVVIDGKGCLAEASLKSTYGHINTSTSKITKSSNKTKCYVYRATE